MRPAKRRGWIVIEDLDETDGSWSGFATSHPAQAAMWGDEAIPIEAVDPKSVKALRDAVTRYIEPLQACFSIAPDLRDLAEALETFDRARGEDAKKWN